MTLNCRAALTLFAGILLFQIAELAVNELCVDEVKHKDVDGTMSTINTLPSNSTKNCIVACSNFKKPKSCKSVIYIWTDALKRGTCKLYSESAKNNLVDALSNLNEATYYELLDSCPSNGAAKKVAGNLRQRDAGLPDSGTGDNNGLGSIDPGTGTAIVQPTGGDGGNGGAGANVEPPPPPGGGPPPPPPVSGGGGSYVPKTYQPQPQPYPAPAPPPQTYQPKPQTYPAPAPAPPPQTYQPKPQTYPAPAPAPAPPPQTYQPKPQTYPAPAPAPPPQTYQPKPQTYPAPAPAPPPQTYQPQPQPNSYVPPSQRDFFQQRNSG